MPMQVFEVPLDMQVWVCVCACCFRLESQICAQFACSCMYVFVVGLLFVCLDKFLWTHIS